MNGFPSVIFVQPFGVNAQLAESLPEHAKVLVVDVAPNGGLLPKGMKPGTEEADKELRRQFEATTMAFVEGLGPRLVAWVDHHVHTWPDYDEDSRFHFFSRGVAPSCPQILTPDFVASLGEFNMIIAHGDFDGVMSAVMLALKGELPYEAAVADANAADTRIGEMSPLGNIIEQAMKANLSDDQVRHSVYQMLISAWVVSQASEKYQQKEAVTRQVTSEFGLPIGVVTIADARHIEEAFDLTAALLHGQKKVDGASVAIVLHKAKDGSDLLTVAGPAAYNFPELLGAAGGAPFRATGSASQLQELIRKINRRAA